MVTVRSVEALGGHRLRLRFSDGVVGEVDLRDELRGPVFGPLHDPTYFAGVRVSRSAGTVVWPNAADIAPETLHQMVLESLAASA